MKTIELINKEFDEKFGGIDEKGNIACVTGKSIKSFYSKQILSLIEELEGKLPKKNYLSRFNVKMTLLEKAEESGFNIAVDQIRATIKSYKKGL